MSNELLRDERDDRGWLTSIWDRQARREVLSGPGNILELHDDNPRRWDAWDLDIDHRDTLVEVAGRPKITVGRGAVAMTRAFGSSRLRQTMWLEAGCRVLQFKTEVEWRGRPPFRKV